MPGHGREPPSRYSAGQRKMSGCRARANASVAWATRGSPVLGLILCAAMIINMFVAATAGTLEIGRAHV